ncbi:Helix-turn-helix [Streptomyces aidingensis]|uniref:Helix-turn-helix n=2 Tax=Streptomyces aidingensis TaxID=910347 RepID=A0A1I1KDS0_9ACTN|nr:helix-turn-helix transcriptional regulator [Streptomyces aidingensis]SFC58927.1 Helix-turn-helix [Streptomyces aidingensis]
MRAWVVRLREFYSSLNMTLAQLEAVLGIDDSTLSRYLNGRRLPEIEFLQRLYAVVEQHTGAPVLPEVSASVRELYYAACAVHEPQRHQVYVLKDALAHSEQRAQTAERIVLDLRVQLKSERERCERMESSLVNLQLQNEQSAALAAVALRKLEEAAQERDRLSELVARHTTELESAVTSLQGIERTHAQTQHALSTAESTLGGGARSRWWHRWRGRSGSKPGLQLDQSRRRQPTLGEQHRQHMAGLLSWYLGSLHRVNGPLPVADNYRARYREGAKRFPQGRRFISTAQALEWADQAMEDVLSLAAQMSATEYDNGNELVGGPLSCFALEAVRALESYFSVRQRWRMQQQMNEIVLTVAERRGDIFAQAVALGQLGKVHALRGEGEPGMAQLHRSEELFLSLGKCAEAAVALANTVPCLGNTGRISEASEAARRALTQARAAGLADLEVTVQSNLGRCHLHLGNHNEALALLTDSYAKARLPYGRVYTTCTLAEYHLAVGEYERAIHWADKTQEHAAEQPFDPYLIAKQRTWLAAALRGLGREDEAQAAQREAKALLQDLNSRETSQVCVMPSFLHAQNPGGAG